RHRIIGIVNEPGMQIVFSDTPGIIEPKYGLHKSMMSSVKESLTDADVVLLVTDVNERYDESQVIEKLRRMDAPLAVLINKADTSDEATLKQRVLYWEEALKPKAVFVIAALMGYNVQAVYQFIKDHLPEHPPFYGEDELTDRNERFFVSEILRGKILEYCYREIPYSTEVLINSFKEEPGLNRISAEIITERDSQKGILIGKNGEMLKRIATAARQEMEDFLQKKIFLEVRVKVIKDWRNRENYLRQFGYE
ncbi:MAG TPA: GTPase Era, partial [Anseongella sp.]|nr:GTPase Era [Anseongella sp.]